MSEIPNIGQDGALQTFFEGAEVYQSAQSRALQLERQAAEIRSGAVATYTDQWKGAYQGFKELKGVPIEGKAFVLNAINFCSLEVPLRMTSQKPYDKEAVVDLFDRLKPEEPIIAGKHWGVVESAPKTVVKDYLSGIGIDFLVGIRSVGVEQDGDETSNDVELDPRHAATIFVGKTAIHDWAESIQYKRTKNCHPTCFESNLNELERGQRIIQTFNELLNLDISSEHLEEELAKEKSAREHNDYISEIRRQRRSHMSPLQRALTPR